MNVLDYTMCSSYMVCQRRFKFRHILDLEGKTRATAPEFGHAMHSALNAWFKTASLDEALLAFAKDWKAAGGDDPEDAKRNEDKAKKIIKGYVVKYQQEPFVAIEHESCFEIPMPKGRTYIGRRDRVVDWQKAIYVMEHKTMSQLGYTTFNRFKPNLQIDGYIYATRQKYPTCHGCVVDAILVAKTKEDYARKIETRTDEEIAQFPVTFGLIADSIDRSIETDTFIPNFEMCTYYGQCPYRTMCSQPEGLWQRIMDTEYRKLHWDPRHVEDGGSDA